MKRLLITVTLLLFFLNVGAGDPLECLCPDPKEVHPCTCLCLAYGMHIKCVDFNDSAALIKTFKVLRDYKMTSVLLHGLMMNDVLPSDLFEGLEINQLKIENSTLTFSEPAFMGLDEYLVTLNVAQHTMIKSSEHFSLAPLNKLTELSMKNNSLSRVRNRWLNGKIPNVETIKLEEDQIKEIEDKAFANLLRLKYVCLAVNKIRKIERSMFPRPAGALETIDLSHNKITSIPYDFFFEMESLKTVIFSSNRLTTLPEIVWKSSWETLEAVFLYKNFFVCDNDLNWLKKLKWPKKVDAKCVAPGSLAGRSLQELYQT